MIFSMQTNIGNVREHNEDCYTTFANKAKDMCFFIVADGMGGYKGGEVASKMVTDILQERLSLLSKEEGWEYEAGFDAYVEKKMIEAISDANRAVFDRSENDESLNGMGTTVVVACVTDERVDYAHVGDSRLYYEDQDDLVQLTKDHSYVEELVKNGILTREQSKDHPQKNIITRALGAESTVEIDFSFHSLAPGDILLLCTDGLSNKVEHEEIRETLNRCLRADAEVNRESVASCANELVQTALDRGGDDNITIGLIVY